MRARYVAAVAATALLALGLNECTQPATAQPKVQYTATVSTCTTVSYGSRGAAVSTTQTALKASGYRIAVDGWFGPQTRSVVIAYQRTHALYVDGIVGPRTHAKLGDCTTISTYRYPVAAIERWHTLALQNGWSEREWPWVACVIDHESDGDPNAGGYNDGGLMQIWYPAHTDRGYTRLQMKEPAVSLRLGAIFFHEGQLGNPWKGATAECASRGFALPV